MPAPAARPACLALACAFALAACSPTATAPDSTPSGASSAAPGAGKTAPKASAVPAAPGVKVDAAASLETLDLRIDGQAIAIDNRGTYAANGNNLGWMIGQPEGAAPAGTWFVNLGASFTKDPKGGATAADLVMVTVTLYKGTGSATPPGYQAMFMGGKGAAGEVAVADGKLTIKLSGDLAEVGTRTKIKVEGTLVGAIK